MTKPVFLKDYAQTYIQARDLTPRTRQFYTQSVRCYDRWARVSLTVQEAADHLNTYLTVLLDAKANRFTVRTRWAALTSILRAAADDELCTLPKRIKRVKLPEHRPRAFTAAEVAKLRAHADPMQLAAINLAFDTGLRRGDLFAVCWSQLFEAKGEYRLYHTAQKTGRRITRRLRPATVASLERVRSEGSDLLLPHELGPTGWIKRWRALGKRAGVDVFRRSMQALRRTGATACKRARLSPSDYLGHAGSSVGLAERFYLDPTQLDEAPPLPPELDASEIGGGP